MAPAAAPAVSTSAPLRILLEGDSITQGFNGDFTWRYRFAKELTRQGVSYDLVGSRRSTFVKPGYSTSIYVDPNFDSDHFARVGSTIGAHIAEVGPEITAQDPDIVVFAAGINDLRSGFTVDQTEDRLRLWIERARAAKPDLQIIISQVLDSTEPDRPWLPGLTQQFRAREAEVVADLSTSESPITLADTNRGWSPGLTYDKLHPTPTGETLIAQRIAEEFHRLGYLPQAPSIFRSTAWTRTARVAARVVGRHAVLTWDQQALYGVRIWMHRVGARAQVLSGFHGGGSFTTPTLARGARYEFRIQMARSASMVTPYGPLVSVQVRGSTAPPPVTNVRVTSTGITWTRSPGATRYVVKYRRGASKHWTTKRTRATSVRVTRVTTAVVRAVNRHGKSGARSAQR